MMALRQVAARRALVRAAGATRAFGGYAQPPLSQGEGGKQGLIADDTEQATGREREELKAFAEGKHYFNRQPVQMEKGQGSFQNPVMVPSELHERIVGVIPKGQDGPLWFVVGSDKVHYVPEVDLHFKLYNPYK